MKRATGALEDGRYRHLPFVEDGKVVGIVSRFDVSRHRAGSLDEKISRRSAFDGARGSVQQNGSAYDDDWPVGKTDHLLRDAADEQPGETAVATAADDDQIGSPVSCRGNDFPRRIAERRPGRDTRHRPLERVPTPVQRAGRGLSRTDLIADKGQFRSRFPNRAQLRLSGNDVSGYLGRSFWPAPSG